MTTVRTPISCRSFSPAGFAVAAVGGNRARSAPGPPDDSIDGGSWARQRGLPHSTVRSSTTPSSLSSTWAYNLTLITDCSWTRRQRARPADFLGRPPNLRTNRSPTRVERSRLSATRRIRTQAEVPDASRSRLLCAHDVGSLRFVERASQHQQGPRCALLDKSQVSRTWAYNRTRPAGRGSPWRFDRAGVGVVQTDPA